MMTVLFVVHAVGIRGVDFVARWVFFLKVGTRSCNNKRERIYMINIYGEEGSQPDEGYYSAEEGKGDCRDRRV